MPELFTDGTIADDQGSLTDYSSSASENFGAGFQRQWDTNPAAFVGRGIRGFAEDWNARFGDGDLVDQKTAQEEVKKRGLDLDIPMGGMSRWELDTLQYLKQREVGQMAVSARPHGVAATAAGFAGGFAAGAVDPVNIASAFIPVVSEARYANWLARAGESAFARAAVRAQAGALEGVVGAAVVEPLVYFGAQRDQLEYGLTDSFVNVMFGGILGGGLHTLGGAAYDWRIRRSLSQLDVGLRAAYTNATDRTQLATLQQATEALENEGPVRANEVLATGLKPAHKEALAAASASKPAAAAPTRDLAELPGLAVDIKPVREAMAVTPAGRKVPVLYAIADLDQLTASHTANLDENPAFPQDLQPRDRTRAQSEAQISNMAAKLNPELLGEQPQAGAGAPIVDKGGIVESGNGRVIALRRVAEGNPEKWREYQDYLKSKGYDVEGIAKPVLVRVRTGELDQAGRVAFTREANAPEVAGLSASEQAIADARGMPGDVLAMHKGGDFRAAGNAPFVQAIINAIAPSQGERGALMRPDGSLSDEGVRRIERAILARAFGDDAALITALTEASEESGIKAIGGALTDVAPLWARMRSDAANNAIDPSVDSTANLLEAVRTVRETRNAGRNLFDVVHQVDLLSGQMDPRTLTWVRAMFRNANLTGPLGRDKLAELFTFYAEEARKQTPGPNLLGESGATPEQILTAKREQDRRRGKQLDLLGGGEGRAAPVLEPDAKARGNVPEPRTGEAGADLGGDRVRDVEPGDRVKVYHASPYKFEKPSIEHVGAGEGAQVYGHGLYATETAKDAQPFGMSRSETIGRMAPEKWPAPAETAQHLVNFNNGVRHAIHDLEDRLEIADAPAERKALEENLAYLREHRDELKVHHGYVYEWTVDARLADLIDLDDPLSKQAAEVLDRLRGVVPDLFDDAGKPKGGIDGADIYKAAVKKFGSAKAASAGLRKAGIKGVVHSADYRLDPEGREFVVFDDGDIVSSRRTDQAEATPADRVSEAEFKVPGEAFKQSQRGWTVDQAFDAAKVNQPLLDGWGRSIAKDDPEIEYMEAPFQKKRERVAQKMADRGATDAGAVTDIVRSGFKTKTPEAAERAIVAMQKFATLLDEGWSRYPGNYTDRKINVRFDDGQVGEIIVGSPHMWQVKHDAHILLNRSRDLVGDARDRQRLVDVQEMASEYFDPAIKRDDGPWEKVYSRLASDVGKGGALPKVLEKSSGERIAPLAAADSNVDASMSSQAPDLSTNARSLSPSVTRAAGVPSQSRSLTSDIVGGPSESNMRPAAAESNDRWAAEDAQIAARADTEVKASTERTAQDYADDAALFDAHLASMRERGLVSEWDEAGLLEAEEAAVDLEHRAAAYEAAAACEMEG